MKKMFVVGILTFTIALIFSGSVFACGERDVKLVDSLGEAETVMIKSACSKTFFPTDGDNLVIVEKTDIKITEHQAKHILEDYLEQDGKGTHLSTATNTEIPGHEEHTHGHGRIQDTHGTISYSFLVEGESYDSKAYPMFVDTKTGEVYGVGCGLGAGPVVFTPDLSNYPDTDKTDEDYHEHDEGHGHDEMIYTEFDVFTGITAFLMELFGV
ncbi:MAG: hypothetical protein ABIJ92_02010 [Candidatus Aenigmatarchaeota archaeon]